MRLLFLLALITSIVLIFAARRLPKTHLAASRAIFRASPSEVWNALLTLAPNPAPGAARSDFEIVEQHANATLIAKRSSGKASTWTYRLEPSAVGCTVTLSDSERTVNPLLHPLADLAMNCHKELDGCLNHLAVRLGESTTPAHLKLPRTS